MHYASITDRLAHLGSGKWAIHLKAREMAASGHAVIELTIGEPDIGPDTVLLDEANRSMRGGRTRYSNGRGEPVVIDALVKKYSKRRSGISRRNILCFPGTQTALFAVMLALVEAGDAVLVCDPYYATYEGVVAATGASMVPMPLRPEKKFHLQSGDLEKAVAPGCRVLLLNTPHNPTGATLTREEIAAIGEVCVRHDLWIVCDEVYEQLIFAGEFASPFDLPDLADRTIVVSSISKSHAAPGFRSGWAVGPEEFCDRLLPISETMLFGGQPFIADMTAKALNEEFDTADRMRERYGQRAKRIFNRLAGNEVLHPMMPEAGMFLLIDVSATGLDGLEFAERLLTEERVAVMPGASFGHQASGLIRLSLTVSEEMLDNAVTRIAAFSDRLRKGEGKQTLST
ncbi:pyridoxal phosphate-dependent aminotransferase [Roseibium album]|uniref:aspartate transaminase n=1 Tax=Roseibium album TaxID=311410 RepID=A0A0M7APK7_9HYPH|nr:pyridoxal phosphate-dependent aminotransferase [Roseibium album]CTQ59883.1 Arginine--pyruvate transaminase AruH [Roseibium album]CTQ76625.1 Arginine--pyruvate transaminase AruH [Roseibium album]CTQ77065.1 Arginine--pyruvate transaminase AruH [Roseibium album]